MKLTPLDWRVYQCIIEDERLFRALKARCFAGGTNEFFIDGETVKGVVQFLGPQGLEDLSDPARLTAFIGLSGLNKKQSDFLREMLHDYQQAHQDDDFDPLIMLLHFPDSMSE